MQTLARRIAKASGITVTSTVIYLGLGVLIHSLIGRIYGPEGIGFYAAFLMFVQLYSMFAIFGLPTALSKYTAEHEEKGEHVEITKIFSSLLIFATFSSIIIGIVSRFITPHLARVMHIESTADLSFFVSVGLLFFSYSMLCQALFQGLLKAFKSALIQNLSFFAILLVILYAYFFNKIPVYYAVVFGYFASGILGIWLGWRQGVLKWQFNKDAFLKIVKFAIPIAIGAYLFFISQWIDRFTIGAFLGMKEMGIFTAGMTIIQATRRIPASLTPILIPSYSKINVYGKEKIGKALNLNIKIGAIFLFFAGSLTFLYAKDIISILYGSKFSQTVLILQILSIGTFLTAITLPASTLITGSGHPKLNLYLNFIGIPTQIILIVLLTKHYGIVGTAIANLLVGLVYVLGALFMVSKVLKIYIHYESLMGPILGWFIFILSYFFIFKISNNSILAGIIGIIIYVFVCWTKVLNIEDKQSIRKIKNNK